MKKFIYTLLVIFIFMTGNLTNAEVLEVYDGVNYAKIENGTYNNIAILIRFKGESEFLNETNSQELNGTYNYFVDSNNDGFSDLESISLKSYINDLTYGSLKINTSFYPKTSNTSYYSIEAPYERSYYEKYVAGSSTETELINWAFTSVKESISLSSGELDKNNDGYIDMVTFIVNGNTITNNMLWPHETTFQGSNSLSGKNLGQYNVVNTGNNDSNIFNKKLLNVITHEFLHIFDYPDLYRYYSSGNPVGPWDIMGDSVGYGQMPLVYTKDYHSNLNLNIKLIEESGNYTVVNSQSKNKNDVVAYKIKTSKNSNEYFMIEFRKNTGNWDKNLPGSGIVIYRVNENVNSLLGNRNGSPDRLYVFRPNEYNSTSAGGYVNGGFFSKESGRTSFGSKEESNYFIDNSLFYSNGENSGIVISEIGSSSGENISFKVTLPNEEVKVESFIGNNRYETSNLLNNDFYKSADTAILVNGNGIADGLSVSPIATYLKAPIFLSYKDSLPASTLKSLKDLGVKKIIIAGGDGVISNKVVTTLKNNGISNITRLGGENRYETSLLIAKYIDTYLYDVDKIVIANGYGEADAMSVSTFAGRDRMPIILAKKEGLTANSYNYLKNENLSTAYILGGEGVISSKALSDINKITLNDISGNRLGGANRYETNVKIIERFNNGTSINIYLSQGLVLADSLVSGPISSLNNGVILLTNNILSESQNNLIKKLNYCKVIQAGGGVSNSFIELLK